MSTRPSVHDQLRRERSGDLRQGDKSILRARRLRLINFAAVATCSLLLSLSLKAGALWLPYFLTDNGVLPTYGASVAIDSQGGVHAVYAIYAGADQDKRPAVYAYCPAGNCDDPANWTYTRLGDAVQDARIVLDTLGHPRVLLFGPRPDPTTQFRVQYQYAQCDGGCGNAANWTITTLATPLEPVATREENNNHYFAVSPTGQLAFIYTDTTDNAHPGTFYMSCAGGCGHAENWIETTLTTDYLLDKPSLTFTPDGHPQVAFGLFKDGDLFLSFAQGEGDGTDPAAWSSTILSKIHGSAFYSLQSNSRGEPRLGLSSGSYATAPFSDHQLYYLWCTNDCAAGPGQWSFNNVGLFLTSGNVDLALDRRDHPRISYLDGQGLGLAWSDQTPESDNGNWQTRVVESNAAVAQNFDVLPIHHCTISAWTNGQRSSLALDPSGNPRLTYDAQHQWSGVYVDRPWENCDFRDVTVTRFASVSLAGPPSLSIRRLASALELQFANGVLESAPDLRGPWTAPAGAVSPWVIPMDQARGFFRIR